MAEIARNEILILAKFRGATSDLPLTDEEKTDVALVAWLRARDMNALQAEIMLRKSMTYWRTENDIKNILAWKAPEKFGEYFPYELCGKDNSGCPVIVLPFGKWNVRHPAEQTDREQMLRLVDQILAQSFDVMKKTNEAKAKLGKPDFHPVSQFVLIVDCRGFCIRHLVSGSNMQVTMDTVKRFEENYPERLKAAFFINTPRIFSIFFSIIKPMLPPATLAKVKIFKSEPGQWVPAILKEISPPQLPRALGGTKEGCCEFLSADYKYVGNVSSDSEIFSAVKPSEDDRLI